MNWSGNAALAMEQLGVHCRTSDAMIVHQVQALLLCHGQDEYRK